MAKNAVRLARNALALAGLVAFQPLLSAWPWGREVASGLFLVECLALGIVPPAGALLFFYGLGRRLTATDPAARSEGRLLMIAGPILAAATLALFLGGFVAVRLGGIGLALPQ